MKYLDKCSLCNRSDFLTGGQEIYSHLKTKELNIVCSFCGFKILNIEISGKEIAFYNFRLNNHQRLVCRKGFYPITDKPWNFVFIGSPPSDFGQVPEIVGKLLIPETFTVEGFQRVADKILKFSNFK